jgi:hypothetical protein
MGIFTECPKCEEKEMEIERLRADLRICWNWGDPTDMTIEDQVVWERLNEDFGNE